MIRYASNARIKQIALWPVMVAVRVLLDAMETTTPGGGGLVRGAAQRLKKPAPATILELLYVQLDKKSRHNNHVRYLQRWSTHRYLAT